MSYRLSRVHRMGVSQFCSSLDIALVAQGFRQVTRTSMFFPTTLCLCWWFYSLSVYHPYLLFVYVVRRLSLEIEDIKQFYLRVLWHSSCVEMWSVQLWFEHMRLWAMKNLLRAQFTSNTGGVDKSHTDHNLLQASRQQQTLVNPQVTSPKIIHRLSNTFIPHLSLHLSKPTTSQPPTWHSNSSDHYNAAPHPQTTPAHS